MTLSGFLFLKTYIMTFVVLIPLLVDDPLRDYVFIFNVVFLFSLNPSFSG